MPTPLVHPRRIVVVSTMAPAPFSHPPGGRWTYVLLKGLVERGHRATMLVTCEDARQEEDARSRFPSPDYDLRTYRVPPPTGGLAAKWRTLRRPNSYMFSAQLRAELDDLLARPWDILHLEDAWCGWLGLPYDRRKALLNFHNLYRLDDAGPPGFGARAALSRTLRHWAERRLARSYPHLMALSDRLAAELRLLAPRSVVHVCPLGIDVGLYPVIPAAERGGPPTVGLVGSMHWGPSRTAAERLLTRLWPGIRARVPGARCLVAGWRAREALQEHAGLPGVEILENAPDIAAVFRRMHVLLYAPRAGSGMKVKILEAFAYGVPVVTTSEGIEGIPAKDGVHAGVCEDDAGLIDRAAGLLSDPGLQERRRAAARALVEAHCGPKATLDVVESVYARAFAAARG